MSADRGGRELVSDEELRALVAEAARTRRIACRQFDAYVEASRVADHAEYVLMYPDAIEAARADGTISDEESFQYGVRAALALRDEMAKTTPPPPTGAEEE